MPSPASSSGGSMAQAGRMFAIGTTFASMVVAGGLLGWGVDYVAHTKPWGLLIGLMFGLVGGMVRFIQDARRAGAEAALEDRERRRKP